MPKKQIVLSPPIELFLAAKGNRKYLFCHEVYATDTIVNRRVLLRSVFGNGPAGWLKLRQVKKLQKIETKQAKSNIAVLFWRERLCPHCANLQSVSNFSPCYRCRRGSEYREDRKCF